MKIVAPILLLKPCSMGKGIFSIALFVPFLLPFICEVKGRRKGTRKEEGKTRD